MLIGFLNVEVSDLALPIAKAIAVA